jgi:hypothetical protein
MKSRSQQALSNSGRRNEHQQQIRNTIGNLKETPLPDFFKRISYRKGRVSVISATARKLAVIIWNMVIKKQPYNNEHGYEFLDQKSKRKVQEMIKLIHKFDIRLMN